MNAKQENLDVKPQHKQAFREIFNLVAKDQKLIDRQGLQELFKTIDYKVNPDQFEEMAQKIFNKKDLIGFEEFLKIFNIKFAEYDFKDVCNAFKLLAKDDDKYIPLDKIKKILGKNGLNDKEIEFLTHQLVPFTDQKGIRYKEFLQSLKPTI